MSIRAMSLFMQVTGVPQQTSKAVLRELLDIVRECQSKYGGKTQLASEQDSRIIKLCAAWEKSLSHGLKWNNSLLKNVSDMIMTGTSTEPPSFWDFAYHHLTTHEKERFSTLRHVWTDRGKVRALIRAAFNERSMERYVLVWLNDPNLKNYYEDWALMCDDEATNLLPSIAAGLNSILFAITVDNPDLNVVTNPTEARSEPIIAAPHPIPPKLRQTKSSRHNIISFDDDNSSISPASSACGSVPKSLSHLCLKYQSDDTSASTSAKDEDSSVKSDSDPPALLPINEKLINSSGITSSDIIYGEIESPSFIHMIENTSEMISETVDDDELSRYNNNELINNFPIEPIVEMQQTDLEIFDSSCTTNESSITPSKHSSIHSSLNSVKSSTDTSMLKARLQEALDRCSMLENRVAELSLENHRLRGFHKPSHHAFNYFSVSVPRVVLQRNGRKKFYAYEVHIIPSHGGDEWTILRRYNDFYKLHKHFQKDNVAIKTLDFPPKKKFGNMDAHFVEQRRQRLQVYLRHLLAILPEVSTCTTRSQLEQVFPFFK